MQRKQATIDEGLIRKKERQAAPYRIERVEGEDYATGATGGIDVEFISDDAHSGGPVLRSVVNSGHRCTGATRVGSADRKQAAYG